MEASLGDAKCSGSSVYFGVQLPRYCTSPFCYFIAVTLVKLLNLSVPLLSHIQNENDFNA